MEYLNLGKNRITKIEGLKTLTKLHFLRLNDNKLDPIGPDELPSNIEILDIDYEGVNDFRHLENLPKLSILTVNNLDWNNETVGYLDSFQHLSSVEDLILVNSQVEEIRY